MSSKADQRRSGVRPQLSPDAKKLADAIKDVLDFYDTRREFRPERLRMVYSEVVEPTLPTIDDIQGILADA